MMKRLGTLSGVGTLLLGERHFEGIGYAVEVSLNHRGSKTGTGLIKGDRTVLDAAFASNDVVLKLRTGDPLKVQVTRLMGEDRAEIKTDGAIPGF